VQARQADAVAAALGLSKVGIVFSQTAGERDYIMNDAEVALACSVSADIGPHTVVAVFTQLEEDGEARFRVHVATDVLCLWPH
jgi:hypothetical protein